MPMLIGMFLAIAVASMARMVGFDRERGFYAVVMIVIASYYELFALIGGNSAELAAESVAFVIFAGAAIVGFRLNLWVVAAALAAHGVFDFFHHSLIANRGVPVWWPSFCMAYDVVAALTLAMLLTARGQLVRAVGTDRDEQGD